MAEYMTFFESYLDAIEDLSEKDQLALVMAILRYGLKGEEPNLSGVPGTIFKVVKPTIAYGKAKTDKAKTAASARWGKNENATHNATHNAMHNATHNAPHDNEADAPHDAVRYGMVGIGKDSGLGKVRNGRDLENEMIKDKKEDESPECVMLSGQEAATEHQKWTKRPYGEFQNVHLSAEDARKLATKFPTDWQERIEALSIHKQSTGRKYKDDYATILNWDRYDRQKEKSKEQLVVKPNSAEGMKRSMDMMKEWLEQSELEEKNKEDTEDT